MPADITTRKVGDITIIDCVGRIDLGQGSTSLRETISMLAAQGDKKVILNLAETSYIDSSGVGEMVSGFTTLSNCGATLKLLALTRRVKDMLKIMKLYEVFEVFDDEEEAICSFT